MAALGAHLPTLGSIGGDKILLITVAFSCSLAMALPVSTPPNAMAYAIGIVNNRQMIKTGAITSVIGMILVYAMAWGLNLIGYV